MGETVGGGPCHEGAEHGPGAAGDRAWRALTWLGLSLAALVGMAEVAAIIQEAVPTGAVSVAALYGPGQLLSANFAAAYGTLTAWGAAAGQFGWLPAWLWLNLGLDGLFIAGYSLLGFALLPENEKPGRVLLWALIGADVIEDVIAAVAFIGITDDRDPVYWLAIVLHVATMVKWLAALALLVRVAYRAWDCKITRRAIGNLFGALWEQRFSVVIVVFLAVVAAGRGADVLEQMPDAQRSWLTWPPGMGWVHAAVAASAQLLLAVLLVFLGRMRTRRAVEKFSGHDSRRDPHYLPWILPPAVLAALALVLRLAGAAEIGWWRLGIAVGMPLLIAAVSKAIAWFHRRRRDRQDRERVSRAMKPVAWWQLGVTIAVAILIAAWSGRARHGPPMQEASERPQYRQQAGGIRMITSHREPDEDGVPSLGHRLPEKRPGRVASVRTAGDALAVAVVAVTGLGLVRSFTAPALPGVGRATAADGYTVAYGLAVAAGIAIATVSWWLANGPVRTGLRRLAGARGPVARMADWVRRGQMRGGGWRPWLIAGAPFLIADGFLVFLPLRTTHWLGVLGTTVIATGTLAVALAVLAYLAQTRRPLPLFRIIRLNVTPVLTLILVIGLIGGIADSRSLLHRARGPVAGSAAPGQVTLLADLQSWLASPAGAGCAVAAGGTAGAGRPVRIQPLILVAAAGGGIRAAWWAEHALADLAVRRCGPHDVFAVSSVSGGSVGMAVLDSAPPGHAGADIARADISRIAGPDALAAGIDGLLLHDLIAGFTGLDLPAAQMPPGQPFSDRAGLMESAWQNEDINLGQPFPLRQPALPWWLLLNSTDVASGCRAIITDPFLVAPPNGPDKTRLTCDLRSTVPGGGSFDFFAKFPCMRNIATVTAAMLSARFPYITPSGVVTSCWSHNAIAGQFVDGGYVDSSGLITLADMLPSLTGILAVHNAAALAQAGPGRPVTLVVPVVVYLGNSPRPVPVDSPTAALIQEPFVPLDAKSAAGTRLLVSDTLLQRIAGMLRSAQWLPCLPGLASCAEAVSAAGKTIQDRIIFVSPRTEPGIAAPLGWVLSAASRRSLSTELGNEELFSNRCLQRMQPAVCQPGVGRMADLLPLIRNG